MSIKLICSNRRARHDYHIFDTFEAGLVLTGSEVKSLRAGHANLNDAYVILEDGEAWLVTAYIAEYANANRYNHEPRRKRKLLLNDTELRKLFKKIHERGFAVIPLKIYFKKGWAKAEIAVAKGKRNYDKRHDIKKRDQDRDMERQMRRDRD